MRFFWISCPCVAGVKPQLKNLPVTDLKNDKILKKKMVRKKVCREKSWNNQLVCFLLVFICLVLVFLINFAVYSFVFLGVRTFWRKNGGQIFRQLMPLGS